MSESKFLNELHKIRKQHHEEMCKKDPRDEMRRLEDRIKELLKNEGLSLEWREAPLKI